MASNQYMLGFIAMAVAIMTILVVGTLAAAGIIHPRRHEPASHTGDAQAQKPAKDPVEAFASLEASLAAGSQLRPEAETRTAFSSHDGELATSDLGGHSDPRR